MDVVNKDKRFSHITNDPRFHKMKLEERKVKIDKRFRGMFDDPRFKLKYMVDKRGRPVQSTSKENLRKYYELSSSEDNEEGNDEVKHSSSEDEEDTTNKVNKKVKKIKKKVSDKHSSSEDEEGTTNKVNKKVKKKLKKKVSDSNENTKQAQPSSDYKLGIIQEKVLKKATKDQLTSHNRKKDTNGKMSVRIDEAEIKLKKKSQAAKRLDEGEESDSSDNTSIEQDESSDEESEEDKGDEMESEEQMSLENSDEDVAEEEDSDKEEDSEIDIKEGPDYARGEGDLESSDEDSSMSSTEDEDEFDHKWGEYDNDAEAVDDSTRRLALCNMDWDRIKAKDLLMLLNSFKPPGGLIHSVKIYPSEFGKQRLADEEKNGPTELVEKTLGSDEEEDEDDEEGKRYHREKLRTYQLKRMRYYYAVCDCDSAATAENIYEECNGMEYESSATKLDLRFIPDEMTFDQEEKDGASDVGDVDSYKPSLFITTALQQSQVRLTWDETNKDRVSMLTRNFKKENLEDMDMKAYLASDSNDEETEHDPYQGFEMPKGFEEEREEEDSEEDTGDRVGGEDKVLEKYRLLMQDIQDKHDKKKDDKIDMEISWDIGMKGKAGHMMKEKGGKQDDLTPWEQYLEKKKNKRRTKKEEKNKQTELTTETVDTDISDDDIPSDVDMNDPYFKEELDQMQVSTNSKEPSTKGKTTKQVKEKKKKKKQREKLTPEEEEEKKQREDELSLLLMDEDDQKQHFNLKNIMDQEKASKKKKKKKMKQVKEDVEDNFEMDVHDTRFNALYQDPLYNIDPTAPDYKKTNATVAITDEKLIRRQKQHKIQDQTTKSNKRQLAEKSGDMPSKMGRTSETVGTPAPRGMNDPALASLVKSVKAKTQSLKMKKR